MAYSTKTKNLTLTVYLSLLLFSIFLDTTTTSEKKTGSSIEESIGDHEAAAIHSERVLRRKRRYYQRQGKRGSSSGSSSSSGKSSSSSSKSSTRRYQPKKINQENHPSGESHIINSILLVNVDGNVSSIDTQEENALENLFVDQYNKIVDSCRFLYSADILKDISSTTSTSSRELSTLTYSSINNDLNRNGRRTKASKPKPTSNIALEVRGECNNCKSDKALFPDIANRRNLLEDGIEGSLVSLSKNALIHKQHIRHLFRHRNKCDTQTLCEPPTANEYKTSLNAGLENTKEVTSITNINSLTELQSVKCHNTIQIFEDNVEISHLGNATDIDPQELNKLADTFVYSYNQVNAINAELCDPNFRIVTECACSVVDSEGDLFYIKYDYTVECRGCIGGELFHTASSSSMFCNSDGRNLIKSSSTLSIFMDVGSNNRQLAGCLQAECLCPPVAVGGNRGPYPYEFLETFNEEIEYLYIIGDLETITAECIWL